MEGGGRMGDILVGTAPGTERRGLGARVPSSHPAPAEPPLLWASWSFGGWVEGILGAHLARGLVLGWVPGPLVLVVTSWASCVTGWQKGRHSRCRGSSVFISIAGPGSVRPPNCEHVLQEARVRTRLLV